MMSDPLDYLADECRRKKLQPLLWTAAGGIALAVTLRFCLRMLWLPTLGITALALIVLALVLRPRRKRIAAVLDTRLGAKNRLEAAEELAKSRSPLARAQREETARALKGQTARHRFPVTAALCAFVAVVTLLFLLGYDSVIYLSNLRHPQTAAPAPLPDARPLAEFRWKAPEPESMGTKLEEVPLTAEADSTSGLKEVMLELRVNGEPRPPLPVHPEVQKALLKPGTHPLDLSIYLDELNVEPYDVVSYNLRGMRSAPQPLPPTVSPVQFIQIRPLREDVRLIDQAGISRDGLNLIVQLKLAQLQLVKQNSVLTYADLAKTDAVWRRENGRVGEDQSVLADKVRDGLPVLIEGHAPADVVDLLTQAEPLMREASSAIKQTENGKAIPSQERALALITEAQKHFMKVVNLHKGDPGNAQSGPKDPFKDRQRIQLPKREETAAGQLEILADKQANLAEKLNQPKANPGDLAKEQAEVHDGIAGLSGKLKTDVSQELTEAAEAARNAAAQLQARDTLAAKEPAGRAAERLRSAVNKMLDEARKEAIASLQKAQRQLNHIGEEMEPASGEGAPLNPQAAAKAREAMAAAASQLEEEAMRQSEQGSALFANQLRELAAQLRASDPAQAAGLAQTALPLPGTTGTGNSGSGTTSAKTSPTPAPGSSPDAQGKAATNTAQTGTNGNAAGPTSAKISGSTPVPGSSPDAQGKAAATTAQTGTNDNATEPASAKTSGSTPVPGSSPDTQGKPSTATAQTGTNGNAARPASAKTSGSTPVPGSTPQPAPDSAKDGNDRFANAPLGKDNPRPMGVGELAQKLADAQARMAPGQELLQRSLQDVLRAKATLDRMANGKTGNVPEAERAAELREIVDTLKETAQRTASVLAVTQSGTGKGTTGPGTTTAPTAKGGGPGTATEPGGKGSGSASSGTGTAHATGGTEPLQQPTDPLKRPFTHRVTDVRDAIEPAEALIALISKTLADQQREQPISTGNPDQAPPAYREAVARYFEQLSRTKTK